MRLAVVAVVAVVVAAVVAAGVVAGLGAAATEAARGAERDAAERDSALECVEAEQLEEVEQPGRAEMAARRAVVKVTPAQNGPMSVVNPFLFCVYHKDQYPAAKDDSMQVPGVRGNGMDFNQSAPFRMYHGTKVAGFPAHPHRGFETVTATIEGVIDHADSLGNAGRYGMGDVQWMHAGEGIVHSEMFPLIHKEQENPTRFFQIWLNLPAADKMTTPDFTMNWAHEVAIWKDEADTAQVRVWSGDFKGVRAPLESFPAQSYAHDPANGVGIFFLELKAGATLEVDPAEFGAASKRCMYFVEGTKAEVGGKTIRRKPGEGTTIIDLNAAEPFTIKAEDACDFLILEGKPINEPVVQHGPFVMNTREEIHQAFVAYQAKSVDGFKGFPWDSDGPVFERTKGRFALLNKEETTPPDADIL
ncbi:Pirin-1 (AtPirin1) [Durusdinium trenchii]|uniref:Pirin-1 (AtPirin1) n=1 Tax=Durusdinium trenchii TaxID=1381693 RepID=A0ABP0LC99_9DINO